MHGRRARCILSATLGWMCTGRRLPLRWPAATGPPTPDSGRGSVGRTGCLSWEEQGGPHVDPPAYEGFGHKLLPADTARGQPLLIIRVPRNLSSRLRDRMNWSLLDEGRCPVNKPQSG